MEIEQWKLLKMLQEAGKGEMGDRGDGFDQDTL
jgi:hypothetical protein